MKMGYQPEHLAGMRLSTLIFMAEAYADANNRETNQPREATQADIAAVFC